MTHPNDVFPDTPRHVTKFCYMLDSTDELFSDEPDPNGFPTISKGPRAIPCGHHNCTDDECRYDYYIVRDPSGPQPAKPPKWLHPRPPEAAPSNPAQKRPDDTNAPAAGQTGADSG